MVTDWAQGGAGSFKAQLRVVFTTIHIFKVNRLLDSSGHCTSCNVRNAKCKLYLTVAKKTAVVTLTTLVKCSRVSSITGGQTLYLVKASRRMCNNTATVKVSDEFNWFNKLEYSCIFTRHNLPNSRLPSLLSCVVRCCPAFGTRKFTPPPPPLLLREIQNEEDIILPTSGSD